MKSDVVNMKKSTVRTILIVVAVELAAAAFLYTLPDIARAVPGRYRVALSERAPAVSAAVEGLFDRVLPEENVPAPESTLPQREINVPALAAPDTPTPIPSSTARATEPIVESTVEPGPTPTPVPTAVPTATPSPDPLPSAFALTGFRAIPQLFNNCGPANLVQVLNWYDQPTTQEEAASYLKPNPEDRNTSPWQLSDYVNEFTPLRSTVHSGGSLDLLKRLVAAGFPTVIEKGYIPQLDEAPGWFGHYLTIYGYDDGASHFVSMDTYLGPFNGEGRAYSYADIESLWQDFNYTFFVIYRPEREAELFKIIGSDLMTPDRMWTAAAQRAQEQTVANPQDPFAWFNLGTSLTRLGEISGESSYYQDGAAAFDQSRLIGLPPRTLWYEFRIYVAYMRTGRLQEMITLADSVMTTQGGQNVEETYLYRGHARLLLGDQAGAVEDYSKALELNPNFYPARIALDAAG